MPRKKGSGVPEAAKKYQFKKGQSGNPEGARAHDPMKRALKKLTAAKLHDIFAIVFNSSKEELAKLAADPKLDLLTLWVVNSALKGNKDKSYHLLDSMLNRAIGPVTAKVELTGEAGSPLIPPTPEARSAKLDEILTNIQKMKNADADAGNQS